VRRGGGSTSCFVARRKDAHQTGKWRPANGAERVRAARNGLQAGPAAALVAAGKHQVVRRRVQANRARAAATAPAAAAAAAAPADAARGAQRRLLARRHAVRRGSAPVARAVGSVVAGGLLCRSRRALSNASSQELRGGESPCDPRRFPGFGGGLCCCRLRRRRGHCCCRRLLLRVPPPRAARKKVLNGSFEGAACVPRVGCLCAAVGVGTLPPLKRIPEVGTVSARHGVVAAVGDFQRAQLRRALHRSSLASGRRYSGSFARLDVLVSESFLARKPPLLPQRSLPHCLNRTLTPTRSDSVNGTPPLSLSPPEHL
jgi:hypothetical protein